MGFGAIVEEAAEAAIVIGFVLLTVLEPYFTNFMVRPIGKSC